MPVNDFRSSDREDAVLVRMNTIEKERLHAEARAAGLTLQQLAELRLLGAAKPSSRGGRPKKAVVQAEELPIAG